MHDKDFTPEEFERLADKFTKYIARYFTEINEMPPLSRKEPGWLEEQLPAHFPDEGENLENIFEDLDNLIMPAMTHWNHPRFMAYFNSTSTAPGILGEYLAAAFNVNGMIWKTAPASVELEKTVLRWFAEMLGVSEEFFPIVYDTASISSMHALAAAREFVFPNTARNNGLFGLPQVRIYISEEAHSSIEKAAITLGFGLNSIRKIPADENFAMLPDKLEAAISEDEKNGVVPLAVVATVGTTSTTAIDPVNKIAEIIADKKIWLHIDAAYGGSAAIVPELNEKITAGWERADSIVVNPHKWLFTPIDFSVLFVKHPETLKAAFSLVPEYLKTNEDSSVTNYMDYGLQLGRRFRSLKFWFTLRYFGREGLVKILKRHISLANGFADFIRGNENFELLAPVNFSVVVFRATPPNFNEEQTNDFNKKLLDAVNESGKLYLSHTKAKEKFAIRLAISGVRTFAEDVEAAKEIIANKYDETLQNFVGK